MAWICRETATGACDGDFATKEQAEAVADYYESEWSGSQWLVVHYRPGIMRGKYWRLPKLLGDLESKYGLPKSGFKFNDKSKTLRGNL